MVAIADLRGAVAATLKAGIPGWQVSAYLLALPTPPCLDVRRSHTVYDAAMARGGDDLELTIRALVAFNNDQGAQVKLDTVCDSTSATGVKTVLEADKTLGGLIADLRVTEASDYKQLVIEAQPPMIAVEFTVEVLA
jgi:hypothetical protein